MKPGQRLRQFVGLRLGDDPEVLLEADAEAALVRRLNAGYGFADARVPAQVFLRDPEARERMSRDALRPRDTHLDQAAELDEAIADLEAVVAVHASPLSTLCDRFALSPAEAALLALAVAYELDADVRSLCHGLCGLTGWTGCVRVAC